jgi:hypothetical protein
VAFRRDIEPITRLGGVAEERRAARSGRLATGTLACPRCDAPVAPGAALSPAQTIGCPYCRHTAAVRDFLSLGQPARPARVEVRVIARPRGAIR